MTQKQSHFLPFSRAPLLRHHPSRRDLLHGAGAAMALPLLDRTMVMQGSNLGHAGKHDNRNLPVLLAGGGLNHGQHLAFDKRHDTPLANLYVSMLQRLGIETGRFSSGVGTIRGLEMAS